MTPQDHESMVAGLSWHSLLLLASFPLHLAAADSELEFSKSESAHSWLRMLQVPQRRKREAEGRPPADTKEGIAQRRRDWSCDHPGDPRLAH
jgi:hypothetical protein